MTVSGRDGRPTPMRVHLLAVLGLALREHGRGCSVRLPVAGEPVLTVWPTTRGGPDGREVVAVQDTAGWSYLWAGARCRISDEGSPQVAAIMITQPGTGERR
ncbi:hypothetical protein [Thermomonospora umbrina]|uniref:Uncharacterized protein n=1 Tax=Thermomonospora umbrina TaxID=111806 RepID=A0A3D9SK55_9ACTN|nr:hypothetical protein [Thermomonospora umbrina]REE96306.1 hypothetical protein DFJ69_1736 [Thermomonospora umbrina]